MLCWVTFEKRILQSLLQHLVTFQKVYYNYYCHAWSHLKKHTTITIVTPDHLKKYTTITIASFLHIWINWLQFFVTFGQIWSIIQSILSHLVTFEKVYYNHNWHIWSHLEKEYCNICHTWTQLKKYTKITIVTLGRIWKSILHSLLSHFITLRPL